MFDLMLSLIDGHGEFTLRIRLWHLIATRRHNRPQASVKFLVTLDRIKSPLPPSRCISQPRRSRRVSRTCRIELAHGSVSAYLVVDRARQALLRTFIFFLLAMYCRFLDYLIVNHPGPTVVLKLYIPAFFAVHDCNTDDRRITPAMCTRFDKDD